MEMRIIKLECGHIVVTSDTHKYAYLVNQKGVCWKCAIKAAQDSGVIGNKTDNDSMWNIINAKYNPLRVADYASQCPWTDISKSGVSKNIM